MVQAMLLHDVLHHDGMDLANMDNMENMENSVSIDRIEKTNTKQ